MAECTSCGWDVPDSAGWCGACDWQVDSRVECIFCGKKYAICGIDKPVKMTLEKCEKSPHGKHEFKKV